MIRMHLGRLLGERKMTMAELARRTGITKKALSVFYHEKGQGVRYETLDKICAALECGIGDLLEYVPDDR